MSAVLAVAGPVATGWSTQSGSATSSSSVVGQSSPVALARNRARGPHLETLTEASVTGAKGVGEGGTIGAPAAVLNAVSDALASFGIGIFEMPITPQRISQLLREAGAKAQ